MERQRDTDKMINESVFIRVYLSFHFLYCKFVRLLMHNDSHLDKTNPKKQGAGAIVFGFLRFVMNFIIYFPLNSI
jgi:uncharacterized membrane protein (DUF485 family)